MNVLVRVLLLSSAAGGCAGPAWQQAPHDRPFQRTPAPVPHAKPRKTDTLEGWYAINHSTTRPLSVALNPGHYIERAIGGPPPLDINHFGQVLDSSWFTNRLGRREYTPAQLQIGPNRSGGPAAGPFTVIGGKVEGATPGLVIRDADGIEFIVKFDPPAFPALSSGAELIATKILWAAGYHVPENYVVTFDLDRLVLDPNATTAGRRGGEIPLTEKRLNDLIALVNPYPDGTIRALFSRHLPGELLGPFSYRGQRADDPNDHVPHERRRSLRGLWLFNAWLNNTDTRRANTMDVFLSSTPGADEGVIRHYLLDFGDALGAAGTKPKLPGQGYESRFDWAFVGQELFTLGFAYRYWLPVQRSPFRSVGLYEAQVFDPARWRPNLPNPAFDEASALDTYWAGSIMARFTPEHIRAIVEAAGYTESGAKEWVLRVLLARQYRLLTHAFDGILPLDSPTVTAGKLSMVDLAVQANMLIAPDEVEYRWRVVDASGRNLGDGVSSTPTVDLDPIASRIDPHGSRPFVSVTWERQGEDGARPSVTVHLRVVEGDVIPVAIERDVR